MSLNRDSGPKVRSLIELSTALAWRGRFDKARAIASTISDGLARDYALYMTATIAIWFRKFDLALELAGQLQFPFDSMTWNYLAVTVGRNGHSKRADLLFADSIAAINAALAAESLARPDDSLIVVALSDLAARTVSLKGYSPRDSSQPDNSSRFIRRILAELISIDDYTALTLIGIIDPGVLRDFHDVFTPTVLSEDDDT